jgi:hypothetical protein
LPEGDQTPGIIGDSQNVTEGLFVAHVNAIIPDSYCFHGYTFLIVSIRIILPPWRAARLVSPTGESGCNYQFKDTKQTGNHIIVRRENSLPVQV